MRAEQTWSLLDPKPVLCYLSQHDEYIVYWNGIVMTHSQALNMAMEYLGIFPTPEMKTAMQTTYNKLYYAGAFETRSWDNIVSSGDTYTPIRKWMKDHLNLHVKNAEAKEVLGWFDYKRARTRDGQPQ